MSRDSIVDRLYLRQRYVPYAINSCPALQKIWWRFLVRNVQATWITFELIPMVEMEMRHHVEGSVGNKFPWIYNHCGVMAAWSRKTLKNAFFCVFLKWPLRESFQNSVQKGFIVTPIEVLCSNFVKFG